MKCFLSFKNRNSRVHTSVSVPLQKRKFIVLSLLSLLTTLTFSLLQYTPLFKDWDNNFQMTYYLFKSSFSTPAPSNLPIVLVKISDQSYPINLPRSPIDRGWTADLIDNLTQHAPKLIILNTLLDRSTEQKKDQRLASAILKNGKVILKSDPRYPNLKKYSNNALSEGTVRYQISSSGRLQNICNSPLACGSHQILHQQIQKSLNKIISLSPDSPFFTADWLKINLSLTQSKHKMETVRYPTLEADQINKLPKGALKDKIIIIETDFPELSSGFRSPIPLQEHLLSEGEVLAQTLVMINSGQFSKQISFGSFFIVSLLSALLLSILFIFQNNIIAIISFFILQVGTFLTASYLFSTHAYEIPFISLVSSTDTFLFLSLVYLLGTEKVSRLETELSLKQTKVDFLTNELFSHSLFNEFSRLSVMIKKSPEKAREYLIEFSEMLRNSLKNADKIAVPIQEQIDYLHSYITQQKIVHGDRLQFDINIDKNLNNIQIPWHLFFPLLENAVKYSESFLNLSKEKVANITVNLIYEDGILCFHVKNPFMEGQAVASTRTGMKNLNQRLSYLFPAEKYEVTSKSLDHFWIATLKLKV